MEGRGQTFGAKNAIVRRGRCELVLPASPSTKSLRATAMQLTDAARRVDREMTRCFAGHANNGFRAEQPTRFRVAGIVLADVNTVAAGLASEVRAIIHDKGDIPVLAHGPQYIGRPAYCVVVDVLETQLNTRRAASIQRRTELVGERRQVVETWRRDQIEFRKWIFGHRRAAVRPCLCKC